jgi:small conductance mechanosensitive channel
MSTQTAAVSAIDDHAESRFHVLEILAEYGATIAGILYLIIGAILVIILLQSLVRKVLFPRIQSVRLRRVLTIFFGTLNVLILVIMGLLMLEKNGIPVQGIAQVSLITVLIGGVVVFFLSPFLPHLPFKKGHLVDIGGVFGNINSITTFTTNVRKFDGTTVFIPNTIVVTSKIYNYSDTETRRIEIFLSVNNDSNLEKTRSVFVKIMSDDERVLLEPKPPITNVTNVTASGVDMVAWCWVKNDDWFATRTDLWLKLVEAFETDDRICMSLPQQEIFMYQRDDA